MSKQHPSTVCRYARSGGCMNPTCRFWHPRFPLCVFDLQGKCKWGSHCMALHQRAESVPGEESAARAGIERDSTVDVDSFMARAKRCIAAERAAASAAVLLAAGTAGTMQGVRAGIGEDCGAEPTGISTGTTLHDVVAAEKEEWQQSLARDRQDRLLDSFKMRRELSELKARVSALEALVVGGGGALPPGEAEAAQGGGRGRGRGRGGVAPDGSPSTAVPGGGGVVVGRGGGTSGTPQGGASRVSITAARSTFTFS
eukprot:TRINITY_DN7600_c1_g1_i1.p1 TRINITY_DN7600_c1_g1~~TRINITY_DN7600_c1_g1_i1.p1  ORF type:complete len:256 (+),score=74.83 TRINITY_DN7600_c1_g1_i1:89-856(+)